MSNNNIKALSDNMYCSIVCTRVYLAQFFVWRYHMTSNYWQHWEPARVGRAPAAEAESSAQVRAADVDAARRRLLLHLRATAARALHQVRHVLALVAGGSVRLWNNMIIMRQPHNRSVLLYTRVFPQIGWTWACIMVCVLIVYAWTKISIQLILHWYSIPKHLSHVVLCKYNACVAMLLCCACVVCSSHGDV